MVHWQALVTAARSQQATMLGHPPIHPVHWYHRLLEPRLPAALPQAWQPRALRSCPAAKLQATYHGGAPTRN